MDISGIHSCVRTGQGARAISEHRCGQVHSYIVSLFSNGSVVFKKYYAPRQRARVALDWFQDNNAEFQLMFYPPNSLDLNQNEPIFDVM